MRLSAALGNYPVAVSENVMATNTAPLLSFGARGQIAKSVVYASWKGRPYTRRHVVPSNPRSTDQTKTRTAFSWLQATFKLMSADAQLPWVLAAKGQVLTDRNAWTKANLPTLQPLTTNVGMTFSNGAAGGLPVGGATFTPGSGDIVCAITAPALPTGWTIVKAIAVAMKQQNPQADALYTTVSGEDTTSTYSITLSGLSTVEYIVGAFFVYQKSSLATDLAVGPALMGTATPS